ncbi:hypothetical protein [Ornithinimicrobium sediminis]|uniref:hypothetical protein n=1 Tax=Ornithinimicrobium sediminis TaxID=2904603 RepID=UPI001E48C9DC|nr:hypothetical protein [Ornithinimicrobium sediminis]MCE0488001.1 hypothetical protein [Ornithinimicrobium sediminis]
MKRIITALAGGAAVATLAFASASLLDINSGATLQTGDASTTCDENGVDLAWALETDDVSVGQPALVYWLTVSDIASECEGAELYVNIDGADAIISTIGSAGSERVDFATPLEAQDIENVRVSISG